MLRVGFVVIFMSVFGLSLTLGQEAGGSADATLQVVDEGGLPHLVDADGMSLYLYMNDSQGASTCYDSCEENWLPVVVEGEPVAGPGVDAALLGTTAREDGSRQVTYNGWPLYTYIRDEESGDMNGQGVGDLLYVVSPIGEPVQEAVAVAAEGGEDGDITAELVAEGEPIFTSVCATCHGDEGEGRVGPRLDGNAALERSSNVINTILHGRTHGGMPAFGDRFSDREVAAVGTYVRNSWSNEFGPLSEEEINELR